MEHLLKSLSTLGSGERKPSVRSRDLAARALSFCWRHDVFPRVIRPSASGGVFFSFWNGETYGDLEIADNGKVSLMFSTADDVGSVFLESATAPTVDLAVPLVQQRLASSGPFSHKSKKNLDTPITRK